ncbi:MAG: hypothetical protein A4E55_02383 [Pelotomaculum sp. PtaU1.Bin035]|nr:MAG: hypothetical protein A4E55_02383 [Pelotomaculum sp. PtaU1.Bin035]
MFEGHRYLTRGVAESLPPDLIAAIWNIVDNRKANPHPPLDYLQVFDVVSLTGASDCPSIVRIVNTQELPPHLVVRLCRVSETLNVSVWVIDSGAYCTMLLPHEY